MVILLSVGQPRLWATPLGTAFTYQGRFTSGGSPPSVPYDFEFKLFDAATAGSQVGSAAVKDNLSVTDGYFTTTLDFGAGIFTGDARWLQIAVRPGTETGAYTTLTPRHELTPTPYTLYSGIQGTANYIPKFTSTGLTDSVVRESNGNIGIGTASPNSKLVVSGGTTSSVDLLIEADTNNTREDFQPSLTFSQDGAAVKGQLGFFSGTDAFQIRTTHANSNINVSTVGTANAFNILNNGNVGIGTTNPLVKFQVDGTVAVDTASGNQKFLISRWGPESPNQQLEMWVNDLNAHIRSEQDENTGGGGIVFETDDDGTSGSGGFLFQTKSGTVFMKIDEGKVGIGTTSPTQKLHVAGNIYCTGSYQGSDERLKTDVQPLSGVLDKLDRVRAISYRWNETARSLGAQTGEKHLGVLAQELEQVFPELVSTPEPVTVDELLQGYAEEALTAATRQQLQSDAEGTQYKAVSYSELTVVLLGAVQELKSENNS
ncbi:MAG: tail fiber domain-containing protein, partial [Planctomycetes bacterium]|nr:tail fiber domain-containing protein [Planctomycetota bacterium]